MKEEVPRYAASCMGANGQKDKKGKKDSRKRVGTDMHSTYYYVVLQIKVWSGNVFFRINSSDGWKLSGVVKVSCSED